MMAIIDEVRLVSLICSCYLDFCTICILNAIGTGNANANMEENIQMCSFMYESSSQISVNDLSNRFYLDGKKTCSRCFLNKERMVKI
jgi:hypothetical protein